jgi:hypothetical protein
MKKAYRDMSKAIHEGQQSKLSSWYPIQIILKGRDWRWSNEGGPFHHEETIATPDKTNVGLRK